MSDQSDLDAFVAARRSILLGERIVTVSSGSGKSMTFDAVNLPALEAEIVRLRRVLGQPTGISGPIVPIFGGG